MIGLNADIAGRLDEVAQLLTEQGANRFRVQAYRHAANVLRNLPHSVSDIFSQRGIAGLKEIPGVGEIRYLRHWSTFENKVWCDRPQRWIWKRFRNGEVELVLCRKFTVRTFSFIPLRKCKTFQSDCEGLCLIVNRIGAPVPVGDCLPNRDARTGVRFWRVG